MSRAWTPVGVALLAAVVACSGGDKIVSAAAIGANAGRLTPEDSAYLANLVANQAVMNFKNLRVMQALNVASVVGTSLPAGCNPTLSGSGDTNGNQIAEDQTLTFTSQNCTLVQGASTTRASGSVRVQDLGALRGYRVTYAALQQTVTLADTTVSVEVNGPVEVQWSSAAAGRTLMGASTKLVRQEKGGSLSVTFGANVTTAFAPTGAGQIAINRNLPAGTFTMTGSLSTVLTASGTFRTPGVPATLTYNTAITTAASMTYDGACLSDRAFAAGSIRGAVSGSSPGALTTGFTGCGAGVTLPPGVKR